MLVKGAIYGSLMETIYTYIAPEAYLGCCSVMLYSFLSLKFKIYQIEKYISLSYKTFDDMKTVYRKYIRRYCVRLIRKTQYVSWNIYIFCCALFCFVVIISWEIMLSFIQFSVLYHWYWETWDNSRIAPVNERGQWCIPEGYGQNRSIVNRNLHKEWDMCIFVDALSMYSH